MQTSRPQQERLRTLTNAKDPIKENYPLIEKTQLEGTPFTLIKQEEKYFVVMGQYKLTEDKETEQQAMEELEANKWLIITTIATITAQKVLEIHNKKIEDYLKKPLFGKYEIDKDNFTMPNGIKMTEEEYNQMKQTLEQDTSM